MRKETGICVSCGKMHARPGRVLCGECSDKAEAARAETRDYCRRHHFCTRCHEKLSEDEIADGYTSCASCREKNRTEKKKLYARRKEARLGNLESKVG